MSDMHWFIKEEAISDHEQDAFAHRDIVDDFAENPEAHAARLKETHTPQVLTVEGRAEVVLLDTETYEDLMERICSAGEIAHARAVIREAKCAGPHEEVTEAEKERREAVMKELMEETERLGLYRRLYY